MSFLFQGREIKFLNNHPLFDCTVHSPEERDDRDKYLRKGEVAFDVGCGVGTWALPMALLYKHVYAFDVDLAAVNATKENAKLNGMKNISIQHVHVYDKRQDSVGSIDILSDVTRPEDLTFNELLLDDYLDKSDQPVSLIKVDVEGEELHVLNGALKVIEKYRPLLIVEVHPWKGITEAQVSKLVAQYYSKCEIIPQNKYSNGIYYSHMIYEL